MRQTTPSDVAARERASGRRAAGVWWKPTRRRIRPAKTNQLPEPVNRAQGHEDDERRDASTGGAMRPKSA